MIRIFRKKKSIQKKNRTEELDRKEKWRKRIRVIAPFLVFGFVFGIYLLTTVRYAPGYADSDEVITTIYESGVMHPPGYPLLVMMGKPFMFLPFGSVAFRTGVYTSFLGALTVVFVYLSIVKLLNLESGIKNHEGKEEKFIIHNSLFIIPALAGSLCLAFSYMFWMYSVVPEKYVPMYLFAMIMVFLMVCWYEEKKNLEGKKGGKTIEKSKYLYWLSFFFGLALVSHQVILFMIPAFMFIAWFVDRKIYLAPARWLKLLIVFAVSMLPNYYIIWAAKRRPTVNPGNPECIQVIRCIHNRK